MNAREKSAYIEAIAGDPQLARALFAIASVGAELRDVTAALDESASKAVQPPAQITQEALNAQQDRIYASDERRMRTTKYGG